MKFKKNFCLNLNVLITKSARQLQTTGAGDLYMYHIKLQGSGNRHKRFRELRDNKLAYGRNRVKKQDAKKMQHLCLGRVKNNNQFKINEKKTQQIKR